MTDNTTKRKNLFVALIIILTIAAVCASYYLLSRHFGAFEYHSSWVVMPFFIVMSATLLTVLYFFIRQFYKSVDKYIKNIALVYAVIALDFIACTSMTYVSFYALPIAFPAMIITLFFGARTGFLINVFSTLFFFFALVSGLTFSHQTVVASQAFNIMILNILCGTIATIVLKTDLTRLKFILYMLCVNLLSLPLFLMSEASFPFFSLGVLSAGLIVLCAIASPVLLTLLFQPVLEGVFNVISKFKLLELTNHKHPLLALMKETAPGTFNHSLTVANLAETCASAIGEDTYLARACAYYHDTGKLKNPSFFKENQATDDNLHDELTPEASTDIIKKHVLNGVQIFKEYRIPEEVCSAAREHHGTTSIAYFYYKAKELTESKTVDIKEYSYPGPTPSTKINAIIMICDSCEAAIRAMDKPTTQAVDALVKTMINERLTSGQFDDCPITIRDLYVIRQTIVNAVCGLYHQRIKYPTDNKASG